MRVDGRVRVTSFERRRDPYGRSGALDVNAVLFWHVWDAKAACTEVGDFTRAVELAAQTALRDAIGRAGAAEVAIRREQLDRELKRVLEEKVAQWGVTILSVEVRDILLPKELQDVMSLEAQAEQRKKARIILMEAEQDICEMMDDMGDTYAKNDAALRLRAMHLLYESVRETGGTVVVPSSFSEGFGDVLGDNVKKVVEARFHLPSNWGSIGRGPGGQPLLTGAAGLGQFPARSFPEYAMLYCICNTTQKRYAVGES